MKKCQITVMRPQGVPFEELTKADVLRFTHEDLQTVLIHIIDANSAIRRSILSTQAEYAELKSKAPEPVSTPAKVAKVAKVKAGSGHSKTYAESSTLNKKIGKSSKYHFLNVQNKSGTFYCYRASTSIAGKTVSMGAHKDELQCALLADAYLDGIGDEKRTRNRDDFPEIMEAYQLKQEVQAQEKNDEDK